MGRLLRVLIPLVLVTAAVAGCIGGDDEPENGTPPVDNGEDQNGNVTNGDNGNVTIAPPPTPVPDIQVSMLVEDEEPTTSPFIALPGTALDFQLDGSGSAVANGSLEVFSWIVVKPDGDQLTGSGAESSFEVSINGTSTSDYGVYTATLRVLSDANVLEATTIQWTLNYRNVFTFENTMFGPAEDGCSSTNQNQAQGALPETSIVLGTYGLHTVSTAENVTALNITLEYETADPTASMTLYAFAPSTGDPEGDCSEAIGDSDSGELTVDGLTEVGQYRVQAQLDGLFIDGYTITVEAIYAIPGADDGADEDDDEPEEEE